MALFPVVLDEKGRWRLAMGLTWTNAVMVFLGLVTVAVGVFTKVQIEAYLDLLHNYNGVTLPYMHISVGALLIIMHLVVGKMSYDCGRYKTRERWQALMLLVMIILSVLSVVILAAACLSFGHKSYLDYSFGEGILTGMKRYKADLDVKMRIDMLQSKYECCGSEEYKDWLDIPWVNMRFNEDANPTENNGMGNEEKVVDNVPYSCCDVYAMRPCIHDDISSTSKHPHYNPQENTLYKQGCVKPLVDFMEQAVILPTASIAFFAMFLEWCVILMIRYLQTSMDNARKRGKPRGLGRGYILEHLPCSCMEELTPLPDEEDLEQPGPEREPLIGQQQAVPDEDATALTEVTPSARGATPASQQSLHYLHRPPDGLADVSSQSQLTQPQPAKLKRNPQPYPRQPVFQEVPDDGISDRPPQMYMQPATGMAPTIPQQPEFQGPRDYVPLQQNMQPMQQQQHYDPYAHHPNKRFEQPVPHPAPQQPGYPSNQPMQNAEPPDIMEAFDMMAGFQDFDGGGGGGGGGSDGGDGGGGGGGKQGGGGRKGKNEKGKSDKQKKEKKGKSDKKGKDKKKDKKNKNDKNKKDKKSKSKQDKKGKGSKGSKKSKDKSKSSSKKTKKPKKPNLAKKGIKKNNFKAKKGGSSKKKKGGGGRKKK